MVICLEMNGCDAFANTYQSLWGATVDRLDIETLAALLKVVNGINVFSVCLQNVKLSFIQHWKYDDSAFCKQTEKTFFNI